MILAFRRSESIPPLAWHCRIDSPRRVAVILHGAGVEVRENAFFEGAWNGQFSKMDFSDHECFGSGGRVIDGRLQFSAPDHSLAGLFEYSRATNHISISNSLPLLLAQEGLALEYENANAQRFLGMISEGLSHSPTTIPLSEGKSVKMHFWSNLAVTADMQIAPSRKRTDVRFSDYESYTSYLRKVIKGVFENAADSQRVRSYRPIATLSSGYDSAAIATLAAGEGCRSAISFSHSRTSRGSQEEDDGRAIADALGLELSLVDRLAYTSETDMPELETWGQGSEFLSIRSLIEGRVVLVGHFGDSIWERNLPTTNRDLKWPLIAGHDLNDLRLSRDFILFPVAFLAAWKRPEINLISRSKEMKFWTLNSDYDRPICRRIAEEKGVPRDAFGQKKLAAGVFSRIEGLDKTISESSLRDYRRWKAENISAKAAEGKLHQRVRHVLGNWNSSLVRKVYKYTATRFGRGCVVPTIFPRTPPITDGSFAFVWAMARLSARMQGENEGAKHGKEVD